MFEPNQKVVCINAEGSDGRLVENQIYTILRAGLFMGVIYHVDLVEDDEDERIFELSWRADRFRLLVN